jgi:hypothetical protein
MTEPLGRVAVFWHYGSLESSARYLVRSAERHTDNLPPPSLDGSPGAISHATYDAIFNIRRALYKFGIITSFRAYVGSASLQTKWELQSHGVTVVECLWNASETMITGRLPSLTFTPLHLTDFDLRQPICFVLLWTIFHWGPHLS